MNVRVSEITPHNATVHWTVPYIAYTPETYSVYYYNSTTNLSIVAQSSGTNFSLSFNKSFSSRILSLAPGTTYSYYVEATNSIGSSNSTYMHFTTPEIRTFSSCMYTQLCFTSLFVLQ